MKDLAMQAECAPSTALRRPTNLVAGLRVVRARRRRRERQLDRLIERHLRP